MDTEQTAPLPPAETGSEPAPGLADGTVQGQNERSAGGTAAAESVVSYAGNRGGRERPDGLVPGSKKAIEQDKFYDRIRKWIDRYPGQVHPEENRCCDEIRLRFEAKRARQIRRKVSPVRPIFAKEPPPIPALAPSAESSGLPPGDTLEPEPGAEDFYMVDWTPEEIAELTDDLIDGLNEMDKTGARKAAALANLPEILIKEIEADAEMPLLCKKIFRKYLPKAVAKVLNDARISSENREWIFVAVAALYYGWNKLSLRRRMAKLIAVANVQPPAEKKAA